MSAWNDERKWVAVLSVPYVVPVKGRPGRFSKCCQVRLGSSVISFSASRDSIFLLERIQGSAGEIEVKSTCFKIGNCRHPECNTSKSGQSRWEKRTSICSTASTLRKITSELQPLHWFSPERRTHIIIVVGFLLFMYLKLHELPNYII